MKRIVIVLVLLLAACGPAAPIPDVAGTAQAVVNANRPTPAPTATPQTIPTAAPERVVPLFDAVQVFAKDADVTDQFERTGAYLRGETLVLWAEQSSDKLSNDSGPLYFVVNGIEDYFRFGGVSSVQQGHASVQNRSGEGVVGYARWSRFGPRWAVQIIVPGTDNPEFQVLENGWPWGFYYGVLAHAEIAVP